MTAFRNMLIGSALIIASALAPVLPVQAMPLAPSGVPTAATSDIQAVDYHYRRLYRNDYGRSGRYDRYRRPGVSVYIAPPPVYRRPVVRRGYSAHVNWCLSRYRSYNPATNRFIAYGGVTRVCRSPYR